MSRILTTIYLAGPMDQVSKDDSTAWRKRVWEYFQWHIHEGQVRLLDPCRRPHECDLNSREVLLLDLKDVRSSDLMLADLRWSPRENTGTSAEIYEASQIQKIPVIGWYDSFTQEKRLRLFMDEMVTRQIDSLQNTLEHIDEYYINRGTDVSPYQ